MASQAAVIIGAGFAGVSAAFALRETGHLGPITIVGDEGHLPYERPPLSKGLLNGSQSGLVPIRPAPDYAAAGIELLTGAAALGIDRKRWRVELSTGPALPYDQLLLATGAAPRRLDLPGSDAVAIHTLRDARDLERLQPAFVSARRLAIVGGGLIGLELAAAARQRGIETTVIEAGPRILGRGVPHALAAVLADKHRSNGVTILTDATPVSVSPAGVTLSDGRTIEADTIIVAIGVSPRTSLAETSGLAVAGGIVTDSILQVIDGIFAAGDCAVTAHPLFGNAAVRLESWQSAGDHGAVAGRNMAGRAEPIGIVPWMWSDQYDLGLYMAGLPAIAATMVDRVEDGLITQFQLDPSGRLVGAASLGVGTSASRGIKIASRLIAGRAVIDTSYLADPSRPLKALLS
ncbi:NAD(P)/FAD-dependent oxidoreductase [Devosia sp. A16]|uniref:NAD(P)/FAD-dependent oxidoreductase n=1 Tax=Devosia sp. A16 TaxID=1736675 RepID=UPI0006D79DA8|nr:FAD-dependent oxidoreductase [Devosia sp. A16]